MEQCRLCNAVLELSAENPRRVCAACGEVNLPSDGPAAPPSRARRPQSKEKWVAHGLALALQFVIVVATAWALGTDGKFNLGILFALIAAIFFAGYAAVVSGVAYFVKNRGTVVVLHTLVGLVVCGVAFVTVSRRNVAPEPHVLPVISKDELPRLMAEVEARAAKPQEPPSLPRRVGPLPENAGASEVVTHRPANALHIRLANDGDVELTGIEVNFRGQRVSYADLRPHQLSEYVQVESAHRYAFIEAKAAGERVVLQPVDFVGEKLLPLGYYTWRVKLDREYGGLTLSSERD